MEITTNEKFRLWRESELEIDGKKGISGLRLADYINEKMEQDYGGADKVPPGARIFQPNIAALEKGSITRNMFNKVASAIYKYCNVPVGYFGDFEGLERKPDRETLTVAAESVVEYRSKLQTCQEEVIRLLRKNSELESSRFEMVQRIAEMERQIWDLKEQIRILKGGT